MRHNLTIVAPVSHVTTSKETNKAERVSDVVRLLVLHKQLGEAYKSKKNEVWESVTCKKRAACTKTRHQEAFIFSAELL